MGTPTPPSPHRPARSAGRAGPAVNDERAFGSLDTLLDVWHLPPVPRRNVARDRRAREIARTRQDIVEAAARVFSLAGYHQATMQAIAREAGFTAASLYTYFESKEELYVALLLDMKRAMLATFDEPVPSGLTFPQRLELLLQRQVALAAARRELLRIAFLVQPPAVHDRDRGPVEFLHRLAEFFAGAPPGSLRCEPDEAARILFGSMHAMLLPLVLDDAQADVGKVATRLVDFFLHGAAGPALRAPPAPSPTAR